MSLHKTVELLKKIGLGIAAFILILIILNLFTGIIGKLSPKKEQPPTVTFGKLPGIVFPQSISQSNMTYTLDTISGEFPDFPDRVNIYTLQQYEQNLLSLRNAESQIPKDEFPYLPKQISDTVYQWENPQSPYQIITYNIVNQDFSLTSSYLSDPIFLGQLNTQDQPGAISIAQGFLQNLNGYPTDIDDTKTQTTLYSVDPSSHTLQPALTLDTTQIIQVDFFQKDIDQLPIYYPDPLHSLISAIVANNVVVAAQAVHKVILSDPSDPSGTYPIKTAAEAFKELQQGKAYIASPANPPVSSMSIRDIELGYYLQSGPQQYLMPIIVFQGDNGFYAYVSAITDPWIQN